MSNKTLAVILPAYNEEKSILAVLSGIPNKISGIGKLVTIVVDDGSTDNTHQTAFERADYVLKHKLNLGTGSATITGLRFAEQKIQPDIYVTIDSDGQHDPNDILKVIQPILNKQVDVVIGSRLIKVNGMPVIKQIANRIANGITFLFSGIWVTDSQSGFRAYSNFALKKINIRTTGYEYCTETISEIATNNLKFCEIPIKVIYNQQSTIKGQSIANSINIIIKLISKSLTK